MILSLCEYFSYTCWIVLLRAFLACTVYLYRCVNILLLFCHKVVPKWKSILQMHCKGSNHRAAELELKERELMRQDEINKRIALSGSSTGTTNCTSRRQNFRPVDKPLIEQSRKVASEIHCDQTPQPWQSSSNANRDVQLILDHITNRNSLLSQHNSCPAIEVADKVVGQQQQHLDLRERQERELKFTAAGWKRDGHGKWFRDENVSMFWIDGSNFDSYICWQCYWYCLWVMSIEKPNWLQFTHVRIK